MKIKKPFVEKLLMVFMMIFIVAINRVPQASGDICLHGDSFRQNMTITNSTNLQLQEADTIVDYFEDRIEITSTYLIKNIGEEKTRHSITFYANDLLNWIGTIKNITINQTQVLEDLPMIEPQEWKLNKTIELQPENTISLMFTYSLNDTSVITGKGSSPFISESTETHIASIMFDSSKSWGNNPILSQNVRFNIHDEALLYGDQKNEVKVSFEEEDYLFLETDSEIDFQNQIVEVNRDEENTPYWEYQASNVESSTKLVLFNARTEVELHNDKIIIYSILCFLCLLVSYIYHGKEKKKNFIILAALTVLIGLGAWIKQIPTQISDDLDYLVFFQLIYEYAVIFLTVIIVSIRYISSRNDRKALSD